MPTNGLFRSNPIITFVSGLSVRPQGRSGCRGDAEDDGSAPPRHVASLKRYAEPLTEERLGNPNGELWHLKAMLDYVRAGVVASPRKLFPWNREQVEALWDNLINGWSIGMVVGIDATGSSAMPWPERFGPWPTRNDSSKRLCLLVGAEKIAILAWSLAEPPTPIQQRLSVEEAGLWIGHTLVADADLRRIRFIHGPINSHRHLPVRLFPETPRYLEALNRMEISPIERDWINRSARRLLEARVSVHLFLPSERETVEAMIANFRQIGVLP